MNGICILVHQANFSEGVFAKLVPLPTPVFVFFCLVLFLVGLGTFTCFLFFFDVTGVLSGGRRNAMVALNDFISSTLTL